MRYYYFRFGSRHLAFWVSVDDSGCRQWYHRVGQPRKPGYSRWNRVSICCRTWDITTSGLAAVILYFRCWRMSGLHWLCSLNIDWQNPFWDRWNFSDISFGSQDMCDISSALYWILCASGFSAILMFRNNVRSRVTRHAMTNKIMYQINQTPSKSVKGFKRYGVKSLGGNFTPLWYQLSWLNLRYLWGLTCLVWAKYYGLKEAWIYLDNSTLFQTFNFHTLPFTTAWKWKISSCNE